MMGHPPDRRKAGASAACPRIGAGIEPTLLDELPSPGSKEHVI
jgi:hypothetical protein